MGAECRRCGKWLREEEAVSVWCGKYGPRVDYPPATEVAYREEYATMLCAGCVPAVWPRVRDVVREARRMPLTDQADHASPVGAEQGAPRLRPDEER